MRYRGGIKIKCILRLSASDIVLLDLSNSVSLDCKLLESAMALFKIFLLLITLSQTYGHGMFF